jgi:hypothetical protein
VLFVAVDLLAEGAVSVAGVLLATGALSVAVDLFAGGVLFATGALSVAAGLLAGVVLFVAGVLLAGASSSVVEATAPEESMGPNCKTGGGAPRTRAVLSNDWVIRILHVESWRRSMASAAFRESVANRPVVSRLEITITLTILPFSRLVTSTTVLRGKELVAIL